MFKNDDSSDPIGTKIVIIKKMVIPMIWENCRFLRIK